MRSFLLWKGKEESYKPKYTAFFCTLSLKINDSQTFKCSSNKKPFLQCVCYWYDFLRWMFFILCDNCKTLFSVKICRYSVGFPYHHAAAFFESVSNEVRILRYLHNNGTMLIPKFKNEFYTCKLSLTNLIFRLRFVTTPHFCLFN